MATHSLGEFHGQRGLVRYSLWGPKESGQDWATFTFHFHALEKEMATHSSVLAWRIPGTGEPDGLLSMGSHRVRHDWSDLAAAKIYPSILAVILKITCKWILFLNSGEKHNFFPVDCSYRIWGRNSCFQNKTQSPLHKSKAPWTSSTQLPFFMFLPETKIL